jgi:nucleoside-diphosphate-sugar epimerase
MHGAQLVVHLAGAIKARSPEDFARANVALTSDVAHAAAGAGARLVHISSLAVTGPGEVTIRLTRRSAPSNRRLRRKQTASEVVVVESPASSGRFCDRHLCMDRATACFFRSSGLARRGIFCRAESDGVYNAIHVEDVARAVELAGTRPALRQVRRSLSGIPAT